MIIKDAPDYDQLVDLTQKAHPGLLVDVLLGILQCTLQYINGDPSCPSAFRERVVEQVTKLQASEPTSSKASKAPPKVKAPPLLQKKKPPPQKKPPPASGSKETATLSKRYALFWSATSGPIPVIPDAASHSGPDSVAPFLSRAVEVFEVEIPSLQSIDLPAPSVFHESLIDEDSRRRIEKATTSRDLDTWFERQKKLTVAPRTVQKSDGARKSVLGPGLAQRVCILTHSLKKSVSQRATLSDVKKAMMTLTLPQDGIDLLIDIIPPDEDGRRADSEWAKSVKAVADLVEAHPSEVLTEDEAFITFLGAIPQLRQRLQCMYIIAAFDKIVNDLDSKLTMLVDGLRVLVNSKSVHLTWHLLLAIGNMLNEGTPRGGQKWFRTQALRRAMDVRGNKGMTLMDYLAIYAGMVLDSNEWRTVLKAKDSGPTQVYCMAKNVLDSYLMMLAGASDNGTLLPKEANSKDPRMEGIDDEFLTRVQYFANENIPICRRLLESLGAFIQYYTATAYFFADPDTLLPLERCLEEDHDSDERPSRDIFMRIHPFLAMLRTKANSPLVKELAEARGIGWVNGKVYDSEGCSSGRGPSTPRIPSGEEAHPSVQKLPTPPASLPLKPSAAVPSVGIPISLAGGSTVQIPSHTFTRLDLKMNSAARSTTGAEGVKTPTSSQASPQFKGLMTKLDDPTLHSTPLPGSHFNQKPLAATMGTPYAPRLQGDSQNVLHSKTPMMHLPNRYADTSSDEGEIAPSGMPRATGRTPTGGVALPGLSHLGKHSLSSSLSGNFPQPVRPRDMLHSAMPSRMSGVQGSRILSGYGSNSSQIPAAPSNIGVRTPMVPSQGLRSEIPSGLPKPPRKPPGTASRSFRFGFAPGARAPVDAEALQRIRERVKTSEIIKLAPAQGTMTVDGITIAAPAMPSEQVRRRPRSSIDATFNFARDVTR